MSRKLKVLQVGKYYPPFMGGIETHLQALCGTLRDTVDLEVLVANDCRREVQDDLEGVRVTRLATQAMVASTPICLKLAARIRQSRPDLVHVHLPHPLAVLSVLASGYRGPIVATYHSDTVRQRVLGQLFEPFLQLFLRRTQAILVTSPNYLATSVTLAPHHDRCHVVPYGIGTDQFSDCDRQAVHAIRREHGDRLLLAVGRLVYYKGFEYLIEAMQHIRGRLLLIGDGPLRGPLGALAEKYKVSDRVRFLGAIQNENTTPYYHAAELFVLPSIARSEAFGIVQIEAMAAGKPVVNTSLDSGVPFVSLDGVTGYTVPPRDPGALAAAINRLLDNELLRAELGRAASDRAAREFALGPMAERVLGVYSSVVLSRPALSAMTANWRSPAQLAPEE